MFATRVALNQLIRNESIDNEPLKFEYLCALETRTIHWSFIGKNVKDSYGLPSARDYGIDSMTLDGKCCVQAKYRPLSGRVSYRELSTFYTLSNGIIDTERMIVTTTPGTKLASICYLLPFEHIEIDPESAQDWVLYPYSEYLRRITDFAALIRRSWSLSLRRVFCTKSGLVELFKDVYPSYSELAEWVLREYKLSKEGLADPRILILCRRHLGWSSYCCGC